MPTAKNGFHILNLHPKKYIFKKMLFFITNLLEKIPYYLLGLFSYLTCLCCLINAIAGFQVISFILHCPAIFEVEGPYPVCSALFPHDLKRVKYILKYFYLHDKAKAMSIGISIDKDPKYRLKLQLWNELLFAALKPQFLFILNAFYFIGAVYQVWYIEERQFYQFN